MEALTHGISSRLALTWLAAATILLAGCENQPSGEALPRGSGEASPKQVTIVGTDYAFEVPDTLPAGPTLFGSDNQGVVRQEVCFGRLLEGLTMEEAMALEAQGEEVLDQDPACLFADEGSVTPAQPLLDLEPGRRYGSICTFRDTPNALPHTELGMYDSFVAE